MTGQVARPAGWAGWGETACPHAAVECAMCGWGGTPEDLQFTADGGVIVDSDRGHISVGTLTFSDMGPYLDAWARSGDTRLTSARARELGAALMEWAARSEQRDCAYCSQPNCACAERT